jgi:hypothetical protein
MGVAHLAADEDHRTGEVAGGATVEAEVDAGILLYIVI